MTLSSISRPNVLVTGATGAVGSALIGALNSEGIPVRALYRHEALTNDGPLVDWTRADLSDIDDLRNATRDVDTVYHLAGCGSPSSSPAEYETMIQTNVTGTLNVLTAAADAGVRRLVFASSASVYGRIDSPTLREDMTPRPASPYAISKLAGEQLCAMFSAARRIETIALRYFNIYSADDFRVPKGPKLIPSVVRALRSGQPVTLYGDGQQTRDFISLGDVVHATVLAGNVPDIQHEVLNVGSGKGTTLQAVVSTIAQLEGVDGTVDYAPARPGEVRHAVADVLFTHELLSFSPRNSFATVVSRMQAHRNKVHRITSR